VKHYATAATQGKGLPSVIGCSLRDALNRLEKTGAEVTFSGTGYVTAQTPSAGHTPTRGTRVHLTLAQ
jgi:beta-lactam-binding protein with PASTA domain